jgi:hypothetical protein
MEVMPTEAKGKSWVERRQLMLFEIQELIRQEVPCESDYLVARIELKTGLSRDKAGEALGTFFNAKFVEIKNKKVVLLK